MSIIERKEVLPEFSYFEFPYDVKDLVGESFLFRNLPAIAGNLEAYYGRFEQTSNLGSRLRGFVAQPNLPLLYRQGVDRYTFLAYPGVKTVFSSREGGQYQVLVDTRPCLVGDRFYVYYVEVTDRTLGVENLGCLVALAMVNQRPSPAERQALVNISGEALDAFRFLHASIPVTLESCLRIGFCERIIRAQERINALNRAVIDGCRGITRCERKELAKYLGAVNETWIYSLLARYHSEILTASY